MSCPLVDLTTLDLTEHVVPDEELRSLVPHDREFRLLDGICFLDLEQGLGVGYKVWDENPWWKAGHVPGRTVMPGVLMLEGVAQVAGMLMKRVQGAWDPRCFIGMVGVDKARFRGVVTPPCKIYYVAKVGRQTERLSEYPGQAFVGGRLVFEMVMTSVPL